MTPRSKERASYPEPIRLSLLEADADEAEATSSHLRADMLKLAEDIRGEVAALRQVLTGVLVAVVVASIMLSLNLVVHK